MKISILVKIYENLDFGQNYRKILILVNIFEKSRFLSISSVKSIGVKIFPKYGQNFQKCRFGSKFENMSISIKNFKKISILVKIKKKYQFRRKSNLVKFVEKSRFWSKFNKMSILVEKKKKPIRFWS